MSDIFREVEEDVRRERYAKIWKQYGDYIVALAALVVIGVAGWQVWLRYEASQRLKASDEFAAASELTDPGQQGAVFARLARTMPGGYAKLARFQQADALLQVGKRDQALALYRELAESNDTLLGGAARLRLAWALADTAPKSELETLLAPLTDASSPWRYMAREILALTDYRTGNAAQALSEFQTLARETDAPQGIRQRAGAMAAYLLSGGDKNVGTVPTPVPLPVPGMSVSPMRPGAGGPNATSPVAAPTGAPPTTSGAQAGAPPSANAAPQPVPATPSSPPRK